MRVTVKKLAMSGQSDHLELVWDKTIWFGFNQAHTNSEIQSSVSHFFHREFIVDCQDITCIDSLIGHGRALSNTCRVMVCSVAA